MHRGGPYVLHPAAYSCNACGNFNLAPTGTTSSCGSAANAQNGIVLPVTINNFYSKVAREQFHITGVVDNTLTINTATLEYSTDGNEFVPSPYEAVLTKTANTTTCTFTLPVQEAGKFYRLRIASEKYMAYSRVLTPAVNACGKLLVFPNPARDFMYVQLPAGHTYTDMNIFNQTGQLVHHKTIGTGPGLTRYDLPAHLLPGTYFVQFTGNQKRLIMRLVKD